MLSRLTLQKKGSKLTSAALSEIVKRKEKAFRMFYMK